MKKSFLFAAITDPKAQAKLNEGNLGEEMHITLGTNYDEMSKSVELDVVIKSKGDVIRPISMGDSNVELYNKFGNCVVVNVKGTSIDIIVSNHRQSYAHAIQFKHAGVNWLDYDVTVVKQGYIFPELKENSQFYVMSLTDGATPQDTASIPFKRIMRPMFPVDNI
ncbi:hypothetical protein SDC9_159532 [bioreactor metagenome]|uniref:Microcystin LR degradation protein MlrC C-terminal domain-containing protein n=1 Tax=bioreactor metagenome TaxID=1076179 RepID=A0A645FE25_9ZZZZ